MRTHKRLRDRGKFSLSKYFQEFKAGDLVAILRDLTFSFGYSKTTQGRTGKVIEKRGSCYYVEVKDLDKPKRYCVHPIHLKKIEASK